MQTVLIIHLVSSLPKLRPGIGPLFLMIAVLMSFNVQAEVYKWIDEQGRVHFGDIPPSSVDAKPVEVKVNTYDSVEEYYSPEWFYKSEQTRHGGSRRVVMYSAGWCGVCKKAKRYFNENGIPFRELDIDTSKEGRKGYNKLNGTGVPIILVGNKRMNGFSAKRFSKMYANAE